MAQKMQMGLGKGLSALLGDLEGGNESRSEISTLKISRIEPNRAQPRTKFDEAALEELAESIRTHGVITPVVVRRIGEDRYQLIAGERRYRASRLAGLDELPARVLEVDETGHPYVYLSTSFHYGWRSWSTADIPVWKIDALTGEEVWSQVYECYSENGLSGGVQGSLSLGTGSLDGILYVAMARYPNSWNGQLLALDTETGEEIWSYTSDSYSWSTPTCFYDTEGNGYVLYTSCIQGKMYWFDGLTGENMTWDNTGAVSKSPKGMVINNGAYVGLD